MTHWNLLDAAYLWRDGRNTAEIAKQLRLPEQAVTAALEDIKRIAKDLKP